MNIFDKYKTSIEKFIDFLKNDLSALNITSAIVYGSSTYPGQFEEGVSDIDICAFTDALDNMAPENIKKIVADTNSIFKDKQPKFLDDTIARRIEFYLEYPDITFDVTLLPNDLHKILRYNETSETSSYDSLEMLIGALHIHSKPLFGQSPFSLNADREFVPFYSDSLRGKRLTVLTKRLEGYLSRVEKMNDEHNPDIIDHLYKCRIHFAKWLFIYKRKYPVNLNKHLAWQFKDILCLDENETNTLMFTNSKNIYDAAKKFTEISRKYLSEYHLSSANLNKNTDCINEIVTIAPINNILAISEKGITLSAASNISAEKCCFNQLNKLYSHSGSYTHTAGKHPCKNSEISVKQSLAN